MNLATRFVHHALEANQQIVLPAKVQLEFPRLLEGAVHALIIIITTLQIYSVKSAQTCAKAARDPPQINALNAKTMYR